MTEIGRAIATICVLTVLSTALDMVMPEGTVKKYAKFIFALAMMSALITPVLQLIASIMEKMP